MPPETTRRSLLAATTVLAAGGLLPFSARRAGAAETAASGGHAVSASYPTQDAADARAVVGAAHTDLERVRELVTARPELAKAAWDWGFGDWETALGAASHMGRRDIADLLIEHGARSDVFYAAMTGNLGAVRAVVEAFPGIQSQHGPHGITLLAHARRGGAAAEPLVSYLEQLGGADQGYTDLPLTDDEKARYLGGYVFGDGPEERFEVEINARGQLSLRRGSASGRALFHQGEHQFHPAGAPSARIRFAVEGPRAVGFEIWNRDRVLAARRIAAA